MKKHVHNFLKLKDEIESFKNKLKKNIQIIVVTKKQNSHKISDLIELGHNDFAENYVDEAVEKNKVLRNKSLCWHFIGRIQSNKIKLICENFDWIHTLSNIKHAIKIHNICENIKKNIKVCIQINIDNEPTKNGIMPHDLDDFVNELSELKNLKLKGIMAIPNHDFKKNNSFKKMNDLFTRNKDFDILSMGMSNDYIDAIENNANMIRIGQYIFGERL